MTYTVTTKILALAASFLSADFSGTKAKTMLQRKAAFAAIGKAGKAAKVALIIRELGKGEHDHDAIMATVFNGMKKSEFIAAWDSKASETDRTGGATYTAYNKLARQVGATIAQGKMCADRQGESWNLVKGEQGTRTVKPKTLPAASAKGIEDSTKPKGAGGVADIESARTHDSKPPTLPKVVPLTEAQRAAYVAAFPVGTGHLISAVQLALNIDKADSPAAWEHMASDIVDALKAVHGNVTA